MKVEILTIGDEILIGQIVNSNAAFIAEKVTELGFDVDWITVVGDNWDHLLEAIALAESRADIVIATGGLGPTHDDITKNVFAHYFNSNLIMHEPTLNSIRQRYRRRRIRMSKINKEQAMVPHNAVVIENQAGSAPGLMFHKNNKYFFVMPGVPAEMASIMESYIIPFFKEKRDKIFLKRVIHTTGIPESVLFEKLGNIAVIEKLTKVAFLPTYSGVNVRLTIQGPTEQFCQHRLKQAEQIFKDKFDKYIWGYDDDSLEGAVASLLITQNQTISVAEYGTNGSLSARLTSLPDVDKFFVQGFNFGTLKAIETMLDCNKNRLSVEGLFSQEYCRMLSAKLKQKTQSDISLAILHHDDFDVTTFIALSDENQTISHRYVFTFHPAMNIQRIVATALKLIYQHLTS